MTDIDRRNHRIFRLYMRGMTYKRIAFVLRDHGISYENAKKIIQRHYRNRFEDGKDMACREIVSPFLR